jgi:hypothetical protein
VDARTDITLTTAGVAAAMGALLGLLANRLRGRADPLRPDRALWPGVIFGMVACGAATGFLVSELLLHRLFEDWVACGAGAAAALAPLGVFVVAAARRAERARLGSIVAGADSRAVWASLATTIALASVPCAMGLPAYLSGDRVSPPLAPFFALASAVACVVIAIRDRQDRARVVALVADASLEDREGGDVEGARSRVDLGLGDDVRVEVGARGAYRSIDRAARVVLGSSEDVLAALASACRRSVTLAGFAFLAVVAHALAASSFGRGFYDALACDEGDDARCSRAFHRLGERLELDPLMHHKLAWDACHGGDMAACTWFASLYERHEITSDVLVDEARMAEQMGCQRGDAHLCELATHDAITRGTSDGQPTSEQLEKAQKQAAIGCSITPALCATSELLNALRNDLGVDRRSGLACAGGDVDACSEVGYFVTLAGRAMLARGCELGRANDCFRLASARLHQDRESVSREVLGLFDRACSLKHGFSCCEGAYMAAALHDEASSTRMLASAKDLGHEDAGACVEARALRASP